MMTDIDAILAEKGSFVKNAVNVLYLMKTVGGSQDADFMDSSREDVVKCTAALCGENRRRSDG